MRNAEESEVSGLAIYKTWIRFENEFIWNSNSFLLMLTHFIIIIIIVIVIDLF